MAELTDFFISHATADRAWAEWIAVELEATGRTTNSPPRLPCASGRLMSGRITRLHSAFDATSRTS